MAMPAPRAPSAATASSAAREPECRLCLRPRRLRRSHIIPEAVYKPLYDEKHRAIAFHPNDTTNYGFMQKGLREPLLCGDCEQFLNDMYEKPFYRMWIENDTLAVLTDQDAAVIEGLDYATFKLFHMSVLFRAGVSSRNRLSMPQFLRFRNRSRRCGGCFMASLATESVETTDRRRYAGVRDRQHWADRNVTGTSQKITRSVFSNQVALKECSMPTLFMTRCSHASTRSRLRVRGPVNQARAILVLGLSLLLLGCATPKATAPPATPKATAPPVTPGTFRVVDQETATGLDLSGLDLPFDDFTLSQNEEFSQQRASLISEAERYLEAKGLKKAQAGQEPELFATLDGNRETRQIGDGPPIETRTWSIKFLRIGVTTSSTRLRDTRETYRIDAQSHNRLHAALDGAVNRLPSRASTDTVGR